MTQKTRLNQPPADDVERTRRPHPQPQTTVVPPVGEVMEIAGREMRRESMQQHVEGMVSSLQDAPSETPIRNTSPEERAEAERVMPKFLQEERPPTDPRGEEVLGLISEQIIQAQRNGDDALASQLKAVLSKATDEVQIQRKRVPKEEHPALQKLRRNLGLQKIKPTKIEWGGSAWLFYPVPPALDNWAVSMMDSGVGNVAAMRVAASCVGIDNAPVYDVLGIDIEASYDSVEGEITVDIFDKFCDACNATVKLRENVCTECGSNLDPFDMPLPLRMHCAEKLHRFFMEDFGPYEDLRQLYILMREQMPDRLADKESLYGPFLQQSKEPSETTPTSTSGDEQ